MPLSLFYWILLLLYVVCGSWVTWGNPPPRLGWGVGLLLFLLLLVLGLTLYGSPVKGG